MQDIDGNPLLPLDYVAIVQRDGSRVKVTIGQIEVLDHVKNLLGVRRVSQNGRPVTEYWRRELKEAMPRQCLKIFNQR